MREPELSFRALAARLPAAPVFVPPADLWPRIAAAHAARRRRRRRWRATLAGLGLAAALAALWFAPLRADRERIDWQARAQALELELDALPGAGRAAPAAEAELARIDGALQRAYDRGARSDEVRPLWQARSELLSALLAARRQQVLPTRI